MARILWAGAVVGAALGALAAWIGATVVFGGCGDGSVRFEITLACPTPNVLLALAWGIPIGLLVGIAIGVFVAWRRGSGAGTPRSSAVG